MRGSPKLVNLLVRYDTGMSDKKITRGVMRTLIAEFRTMSQMEISKYRG